jgi:hypothetical protein
MALMVVHTLLQTTATEMLQKEQNVGIQSTSQIANICVKSKLGEDDAIPQSTHLFIRDRKMGGVSSYQEVRLQKSCESFENDNKTRVNACFS